MRFQILSRSWLEYRILLLSSHFVSVKHFDLTSENSWWLLELMAQNTSALLALPTDILVHLPYHLANLEDFRKLSFTCRQFRGICHSVSSNLILRLAAASSRTFFQPEPYFLVAATAKQIGYWALQNKGNAAQLRQALKHGIGRLFDLCIEKAGFTMDDIRRCSVIWRS